jgi:hypothetical protein
MEKEGKSGKGVVTWKPRRDMINAEQRIVEIFIFELPSI